MARLGSIAAVLVALCLLVHLGSCQTFTLTGDSVLTLTTTQYSVSGAVTIAPTAATALTVALNGFRLTVQPGTPGDSYPSSLTVGSTSANAQVIFSSTVGVAGGFTVNGANHVLVTLQPNAAVSLSQVTANPATFTTGAASSISATGSFSATSNTAGTSNSFAGSISATGSIAISAPANSFSAGTFQVTGNLAVSSTTTSNTFTGGSFQASTTISVLAATGNSFAGATLAANGALTLTATANDNTLTSGTFSGSSITVASGSGTTSVAGGTYTAAGGALNLNSGIIAISGGSFSAGTITVGSATRATTISAGTFVSSAATTIRGTTNTIAAGTFTAQALDLLSDTGALTITTGTFTASGPLTISGATASTVGSATFVSPSIRVGPSGAFGSVAHAFNYAIFRFAAGSLFFNTPTTFNGLLLETTEWSVDVCNGPLLSGPSSAFTLTAASRAITSALLPGGASTACVWVTSATAPNFLLALPNDVLYRNYVFSNPRALTVYSTNGGMVSRC